jgi:hypothetical protein
MDSELKKVTCKIVDIKDIPAVEESSAGQIVSVHFTFGEKEWYKAFRLAYDRPISMEEFKRELVRVGIWPDDFLAYVKAEREKPFELTVEGPPVNTNNSGNSTQNL